MYFGFRHQRRDVFLSDQDVTDKVNINTSINLFFIAWFSLSFTVKLTKSWTPEIFMECYCVVRNKPIRHEITKLRTAAVISLWFWGLLACPELYCDWPVHNQHSQNFSGVHGFLSLTVLPIWVNPNDKSFIDGWFRHQP